LVGSIVDVGNSVSGVSDATASNVGGATLRSLVLTSKLANTFSDSSVIADVIDSIVTGPINAAETNEGIAATTIKSATLTTATGAVHIPAADLLNNTALGTFLTGRGASLGTFVIDIL
jgi:hypothetical protein